MKDFYPPIEPYQHELLQVSPLHQIYVEQVGNPNGYPVIFLHGGPGGGCSPDHRRFFDPKYYRVILFDQRGCGRSLPFAELAENTTWDLISDIEKIREKLKIKQWHVFGGSWGSTLALAYAESHPNQVSALILRGIFLCRPSEIKWFYQEGASQIFPDAWEKYYNFIPENERHDFVKAYHQRLTGKNEKIQLQAAQIWSQWEMATSYLIQKQEAIDEMNDPSHALPFARIESHYFVNNAFFKTNNFLLENIHQLKNIPTTIIQGRYDIVCPAKSAWDLKKALPQAQLIIISNAGHAASEPGIRSSLVETMDNLKTKS